MQTANKIEESLKMAMRSKDVFLLSLLRMVKSAINYKKIELGRELTEEEVISLLRTEIKKRNDAIEIYIKGNRNDLAEKEKNEVDALNNFLPAKMTKEDLTVLVQTVLDRLTAEDKKNFGKVMPAVMAEVAGRASGSEVSQLVKEILG